ncbi:MAG: hypothetical protein NZ108_02125, partial [Bacteroidia bacterium]|nr:hypothetical protein [Bacteroidia bacterium]
MNWLKSLVGVAAIALPLCSAAQIDITKSVADPNTLIFNDGKTTVQDFIYKTLEGKSSCCGNDAIYLEIKTDAQGTVTSAKALTGKNDCYKSSVIDIVKYVRFNMASMKTPRPIYMEVKPIIACGNKPNENTYTAIVLSGSNDLSSTSNTTLTNTNITTPTTNTNIPTNTSQKSPTYATEGSVNADEVITNCENAGIKVEKYKSSGDRKPQYDAKLNPEYHKAYSGPTLGTPSFTQEQKIELKKKLRAAGICGLAHVLAELRIMPDGSVQCYRIFKTNDPKVTAAVQSIFMGMRFSSPGRFAQNLLVEFKADINCT